MYNIGVLEGRSNLKSRTHPGRMTHLESILETAFSLYLNLDETTFRNLAQQTGLSEQNIRKWFEDKRERTLRETNKGTLPNCEYAC